MDQKARIKGDDGKGLGTLYRPQAIRLAEA